MKQNISIFWIIWSAIFISLLFYPFVLPTVKPEEGSVDVLFMAMLIGPFAFSVLVGWVIIPKIKTIQSVFIFFIIGIAVAESLVFFWIIYIPLLLTYYVCSISFGSISIHSIFHKNRIESKFTGHRCLTSRWSRHKLLLDLLEVCVPVVRLNYFIMRRALKPDLKH